MTVSPQDLKDLLRLAEAPAGALDAPGAKLRWASPPALALVLARWISREGRLHSLWVDAPSEAEARTLAQDLQALLPGAGVAHFPGFAPYVGGESSPPGMVLRERLSALVGLLERRVQVLVTGPLTACERLPHPTWFQKQKLDLRKGAEVPRDWAVREI
jgi:transcription-repair coupling factor (superfamily II helicase)